jgi:hypothetical protein
MSRAEDIAYVGGDQKWEDGPLYPSTKDKMRKAAAATAAMLNGTWDWGSKTVPRHQDGSLRAPKPDVLEAAGWARTSNSARRHFNHIFYRKCLKEEMMRLDKGFKAELATLESKDHGLGGLSTLLLKRLWEDLSDEERSRRIPFKVKAELYTKVTELSAKMDGDYMHRGGPGNAGSLSADVQKHITEGEYGDVQIEQTKVTLANANRWANEHPEVTDVEAEEEQVPVPSS